MATAYLDHTGREALIDEYRGRWIHIGIDRPIGYVHHKEKYDLVYPINYGYVPDVLGGDGEELDVYLLGVDQPVDSYDCRVIAVVRRRNDVEDKLIAAPEGVTFSKEEITRAISFQEQYYDSEVEVFL